MKENIIATKFEPYECISFAQSTKIGTHENKAIHSMSCFSNTLGKIANSAPDV